MSVAGHGSDLRHGSFNIRIVNLKPLPHGRHPSSLSPRLPLAMGNTLSAEVHRKGPQKLSKPRTGNPSAAGLSSPDGFVNSPDSYSFPGLVGHLSYPLSPATSQTVASVSFEGTVASEEPVSRRTSVSSAQQQQKQQQKELNRRSLFRSRSTQRPPQPREHPARRHSSIGPANRRIGDRGGRESSMTYDPGTSAYHGGTISEKWVP